MSRPLDFEALLTTRDFEQGIRNIENQIRNLTQQTERETSQMDSLFRNLATGIGAYFSVQALQGFTQQLINVRGEFQKTEIAFATMLGSQEKAQNLMAEMVDLAAKTPFGLQEISEGAKRLLAFQIPAEEVVDTLTRMGDVAAGLGVPMGQLIHVYGQVKAQGKLMTNDLYQFMNAGIPILSELGSVLGKTEAEVKEMVGQGKIGFSEIQQVIQNMTNEGGLFFNLMEKQSASLSGQIANLQDALDQMFNKIGQANEGLLSNGIQAVTYLVENYQKVGVVLAGLVSTYGAYKTAIITTSALQQAYNKTIMSEIANLSISEKMKLGRAMVTQRQAKASLEEAKAEKASTIAKYEALQTEKASIIAKYKSLQAEVSTLAVKKEKTVALATEKAQLLDNARLQLALANMELSALGSTATARQVSIATKNVEKAQNQVLAAQETAEITRKNALATSQSFYNAKKELETAATEKNIITKNVEAVTTAKTIATKKVETATEIVNTASKNANAIATTRLSASQSLQIALTKIQIGLQKTLNATLLEHPYAFAIGAVVGLIAVLYSLDKSYESVSDKLQKITKSQEENKSQAQEYISILKDESTSILEKAEAYEKLIAIAPETFGNMTKEQIIAMDLKEAHAQLNKELEKGTKISRQKILNETKQELESLLKLKDLNVDDADGKISSRIEELRKGVADIERENKKINEALMSQNASLDEQQKYWQKEEQEIIKVIEAIKKKHPELDIAKAKAGEIPPKIAGIQTAVDGLDFSGLISRLKFVQSQAKNVANALNGAKNTEIQKNKNDYNKADWETQKNNSQKELDELTKKDIGGNKWKELTVKIKEADKALGAYSIREEKVTKAKKPTKAQIDAPIKGSLGALEKELSDLNTKINNKTLINNKELMKSLLAQRENLEKKIKEIKAQMDKNSWQEELSELERQWKVRYQIAKHYGEEIAKTQFPNLKGESYFDEIKNRYEALDKKQSSGSKLSNEEIEQWQKLKEILDNLQGTKDPFTNWKEHLEQTLSGFETFTQKIEYLQTQIENLTPEQKSQGYEAVLREQLANAEKEYQQFYDNFLKEQQTFEEKKITIEKKYADLSAKAKNDAQKNAIEKAKSNELTDLFFEETQKSDQWAKIFTDMNAVASSSLEKFKTILQEKLKDAKGVEEKAKIGEFIKKIDEQLENRRGLDFSKRFKKIKNDIQAFVTAKKAVTEAQKEYNKAVADFGKNSAEAQKKEQELLNAEQKRTDAQAGLNKKLGDLGNKTSKYAKIGVDAVNDIREAFDDLGVSLDNDFGDTLDKLQQSFEGINKTAEGAAQFASGDYVGGTIKMIGGIIKTFSGWFNNDKKKERAIKREKEALDSLKNTYEELSHAIDRVFKAKEYSDQTKLIQNLEQQKIHLQNMIRQEGAKKKSDQGKISDWQNQINQINRSIIDLKDNLVKDVLQTDLSSFATKIGDALVDAFGRGANAAKDLEKVASDVLKNMLKHQLDLMLQKRYSGTLERLFKATGLNDDGTGTFKGISRQDQERFKEEIKNASQIANSFLEGYKEIFAGIGEDNESLKGAIKGMSEQTADVLVGQFNAIRINTGEIMKYSIFNVETLKSSLQVLNQIEENTRNLYQMRKDISDMNSKISSKGNSLRANGID